MSSIYQLSDSELFQLRAIDPHLGTDWQELLSQLLPRLDEESRLIVNEDILAPRGIYYNKDSQKWQTEDYQTLAELLKNSQIRTIELLEVIEYMIELIEAPTNEAVEADKIADAIESALSQLKRTLLDDRDQPRIKYEILKAFLYDMTKWIEQAELTVYKGMRKIDQSIAKMYFKEVFVKQQIQGWDFHRWEAVDIEGVTEIPKWIKKAVEDRNCYLVDNKKCWFLIAPAEREDQNPFSFRRFLFEDDGGGTFKPFITHIAIPKSVVNKPEIVQFLQNCIGRMYTLDRTISANVRQFIKTARQNEIQKLRPILKKPLSHDGSDVEDAIRERLEEYERQFTTTILAKIPSMVHNSITTNDDKNYFFYHISAMLKNMVHTVENFRLQPVTRFSAVAEVMSLKLVTYQVLLMKIQDILCDKMIDRDDKTEQITEPMQILIAEYETTQEAFDELEEYREEWEEYEEIQENGNFFKRLFSREPAYDEEELDEEQLKLTQKLFLFIVRLEKQKRHIMVYPEFEVYKNLDNNYRHYAFADGEMGIERLPKIVRLNEDRSLFDINELKAVIDFDVMNDENIEYLAIS